jgi:hypothetical protein
MNTSTRPTTKTRTAVIAAAATVATIVGTVAACSSGGSATATLSGTYTDIGVGNSQGNVCATYEGPASIAIQVDGLASGTSAAIHWNKAPTPGRSDYYGCTGTWSAVVPAARISYALSLTSDPAVPGSVTIATNHAGQAINLDDASQDSNGNTVLAQSGG